MGCGGCWTGGDRGDNFITRSGFSAGDRDVKHLVIWSANLIADKGHLKDVI